ncbi:hypothetical protein ACM73O_29425 [Pseudomonas aeruginosa]|nr:hypothetical protein [Pseudomonas aeruginosa]HCE6054325.1 hypothetical protein [Pseudomonas aeruginosa]
MDTNKLKVLAESLVIRAGSAGPDISADLLGLIAEVERLNARLKAENDELRRLCSCAKQYDLSMTLRRMIDAVLEGDKP